MPSSGKATPGSVAARQVRVGEDLLAVEGQVLADQRDETVVDDHRPAARRLGDRRRGAQVAPPEAEHIKTPFISRLMVASAPLNPFVSIFGISVTRTEILDEIVFSEEAKPIDVASTTPIRGKPLRFRLRKADGTEVAKGSGTTSDFGDVTVAVFGGAHATWSTIVRGHGNKIPFGRDAKVVEITCDGKTERVAIPKPPAGYPYYPRLLQDVISGDFLDDNKP